MAGSKKDLSTQASQQDVDAFLRKVAAAPVTKAAGQRGRLLFAMDATASRAPTWDHACRIQAEMFRETAKLGGLDIQLAYFRGFEQFDASDWYQDAEALMQAMTGVQCLGGTTQITKVLRHAVAETRRKRIHALVYVGDCVEEDPARLSDLAGQLAMLGVPVFLFQEGADPLAEQVFREIARVTQGAYCRFDANSAQQLRDLLNAVAVYAAGGRRALEQYSRDRRSDVLQQLTRQLPKPAP